MAFRIEKAFLTDSEFAEETFALCWKRYHAVKCAPFDTEHVGHAAEKLGSLESTKSNEVVEHVEHKTCSPYRGRRLWRLSATRALKNAPVQVILIDSLTDKFGGAMATVAALTATGLFHGQTKEFFGTIQALATAADAAVRER